MIGTKPYAKLKYREVKGRQMTYAASRLPRGETLGNARKTPDKTAFRDLQGIENLAIGRKAR